MESATPQSKHEQDPREIFQKSELTLRKFEAIAGTLGDKPAFVDAFRQFIARVQGGYILKVSAGNRAEYREITTRDLGNYIRGSRILKEEVVEMTIDESGNRQLIRKTQPTKKPVKFHTILDDSTIWHRFASFDGVRTMTRDPDYLSMWRPPVGRYITGYTQRVIRFFEGQVSNKEGLHQEIRAHAALLRNPDVFLEQVFIHYSEAGYTGKSLLAHFLGLPFGKYAASINHSKLTGKFSGEVDENIKIHVEELKSGEYQNHDFALAIKERITPGRNRKTERKYHGLDAVEHSQILSLNTNVSDWYGLINADKPTLERLVPLNFVNPKTAAEWDSVQRDLLIDSENESKCRDDVAFTIYTDLMDEKVIPLHGFSSGRYDGKDKQEIIARLQDKHKGTVGMWFFSLTFKDRSNMYDMSGERDELAVLEVIKMAQGRGSREHLEFVVIYESSVDKSYNSWKRIKDKKRSQDNDKCKEYLLKLGFEYLQIDRKRAYRMKRSDFDKLEREKEIKEITDEIEYPSESNEFDLSKI
jgi:hypothetical protein